MPSKNRPDPIIPDHEILRKIGGGAYGEVWLGRGVTGALRAVKVVWREDFEDARGFEREFEGILKFEPISRDHPGLVHILHVGRSPDGTSFYYYVMELGDDVRAGQDINPIEYEPRTLRADTKQAINPQLDTATCIDVGLRLAEALHHLHERGLAHRDVKPSNVIFLNGRAKLADIGLVAARDQRTFVGTEGFVPPEGPGSAQADVYSLGKVLYEIATGKDRLDFPELPDTLPAGPDRKRWLELNKIICDICEPRLSKRMITTAAELAEALRRLQRGKRGRRRKNGLAVWLTTFLLLGFTGWAGVQLLRNQDWSFLWGGPPPAPVVTEKKGFFKIISSPQGADVIDENGERIGTTATGMMEAKVGQTVRFLLKKTGFQSKNIEIKITPDATEDNPLLVQEKLMVFEPPKPMEVWVDHLGSRYQPKDKQHVSEGFVTESAWKSSQAVTKWEKGQVEFLKFSENGKPVDIVLATKEAAVAFCDWLRVGGMAEGYLEKHHEVVPAFDQSFQDPAMSEKAKEKGLRPFHVIVREINYGMIRLTSNPPGASVYINGEDRGITGPSPLLINEVKPGKVDVYLVLNGHKPKQVTKMVIPGEALALEVKLDPNDGVVFGKAWQNGLGMKFVPIKSGTEDLMVSIWETRVSDYNRFVAATGYPSPRTPEFTQSDDSPVVYVRREDAIAFCKWLTEFERKKELISKWHEYRLPTDMEWSRMAGLDEMEGPGPLWRDLRKAKSFPWGDAWPPPPGAGNFADTTAALAPGILLEQTISNYTDEHAYTAPVGSFKANELGIHDLSGNVEEWVSDNYDSTSGSDLGVLRGGGWATYEQDRLYAGSRNPQPVTYPDSMYGFRVVLWKIPTPEPAPDSIPSPLDVPATKNPTTPIPPDNG